MQVNITARHLKLTPAIADYVQRKLEKANRYFDHLIWAQAILTVEKSRHSAEVVIHASGRTFRAKKESTDLYAAIDLASDQIDEQLRRYKERRKIHRTERGSRSAAESWRTPPALEEAPPTLEERRISGVRVMRLAPLSLDEAISSMERSDSAHWIFLNKENERVTMVYRKPDKSYGVVEAVR